MVLDGSFVNYAHLSKLPSDLKRNGTQDNMLSFCGSAFMTVHVALTRPNVQPSDGPKAMSVLLSSASRKADYF